MKLNLDCMRDILLKVESLSQVFISENNLISMDPIYVETLFSELPTYTPADIYYSVTMLSEAGFLLVKENRVIGGVYSCSILRMTYSGHEFLCKIQDEQRWSSVRRGLSAVRDYSLSAISALAEGVTSAAIGSYLSTKQ